eukprot:TRINITY_DN19083_c0_g1_i1.p1 TRINITY_DN19083_c0_g1~~TRINITY_DN19083_c0_g1_i1.p1  ORF type:complete len:425 (+),score=65.51 TRINITY_DN19083_c0_g1_i1:181-1275(+)
MILGSRYGKSGQRGVSEVISESALRDSMDKVASAVAPWHADEYVLDSLLQEAVRNHGRVDLMHKKAGGPKFAVKRMPTRWVRETPADFNETYPTSSEKPWVDLGLLRHLNSIKYPYVCELLGVYRDDQSTYVAASLATEGDLFSWCEKGAKPGPAREEFMVPMVIQIFSAVKTLHELGIAHRDLSLENILLTNLSNGDQRIKLIDFGMATFHQICRKEVRGKDSYQAPEMHTASQYDAFSSDAFALGVVVFAMASQDYPWTSTKPNTCQLFAYISAFGLEKFFKKRKLRKGNGEHLIEVISSQLSELLIGLLEVEPDRRLSLGESVYGTGTSLGTKAHRSAWDMAWIKKLSKQTGCQTGRRESI